MILSKIDQEKTQTYANNAFFAKNGDFFWGQNAVYPYL